MGKRDPLTRPETGMPLMSRQVHEELFGQPVGPGPNTAGNEAAGEGDGEREEAGVVPVG